MYVPFSETKRNVNLLQRFAQPQTTSMVTVVHYMSSNRHDKHVKITSACVNIFTRSYNQPVTRRNVPILKVTLHKEQSGNFQNYLPRKLPNIYYLSVISYCLPGLGIYL